MRESEIQNKIAKLRESEAKQKEKVDVVSKAYDKVKNKYDTENNKLNRIQADIQRCEGQLYKMAMADYGVESYEDLMAFLRDNLTKESNKGDD